MKVCDDNRNMLDDKWMVYRLSSFRLHMRNGYYGFRDIDEAEF